MPYTPVPDDDHQMQRIILIVEDEKEIGELLCEVIAYETPFHSIHVMNGMEALEVVETVIPHLFLLDYQLPLMTGLQLLDHLQNRPEFAHIPTIVMSASLPVEEVHKRQLLSLRKPFDLDTLLTLLKRALSMS
jgi:CheY-like chemotaxis protein